jgi:predicted TIM-barrel fold metal-dependent hydrolase
VIDAYAHVGLPRFQTVANHLAVMDAMGVRKALVCAFDSCTDLHSVHHAISRHPKRFRGLGMALGRDRRETERGIAMQIAAGFIGLRVNVSDLRERPWILDALKKNSAFPFMVGQEALAEAAPLLLRYLDSAEDALVIGGHFAGPTDPAVLERHGSVRDLFRHPRFAVVMSRQGIFPRAQIEAWALALLDVVGWDRLLWGTEAPVLYWRDEPVLTTPKWIEKFRPSKKERDAFFTGNAQRLIFDRPAAPPAALKLPFDPAALELKRDVPMWPFGLPMDTGLPARLIDGWMAWGGETRGPLSAYLGEVLDKALPQVRPDA